MSCPAVIHVYANLGLPKAVVVTTPGPVGPIGSRWLGGTAAPAANLGVVGDWYIRSTGAVYGPKTEAGWGSVVFTLQAPLSTAPAQPLAAQATAGSSGVAADAGHQHPFPSASQVGADPQGTASTAVAGHLQAIDPHPQYTTAQQAAAAAPVQSVSLTGPAGWGVSSTNTVGNVTLTLALPADTSLVATADRANWNTAYDERRGWDGGSANLNPATGRASLQLGTAAQASTGDFATAAQGVLAASAVQPAALASGLASKADLVNGLVPTSQIPAIAISEYLGSVNSQAAMLALTGQRGDWCIRLDRSRAWVLSGDDASQLANWVELPTPVDAVSSVNGQAGVVVLGPGDVGAQPIDSDLTAIAALSTTAYGRGFLALASAAAGRTALELGTAAQADASAFTTPAQAAAAAPVQSVAGRVGAVALAVADVSGAASNSRAFMYSIIFG